MLQGNFAKGERQGDPLSIEKWVLLFSLSISRERESKQELVSCKQLLLLSVEKNSKSQYTQEHEKSQTEHRQSRIRDVAEDPNLVPIVTGGFRTFCY